MVSYTTVSPLPRRPRTPIRRSALCCAFHRVSPSGRYPAPSPCGVPTFLDARGRRDCLIGVTSLPVGSAARGRGGHVVPDVRARLEPCRRRVGEPECDRRERGRIDRRIRKECRRQRERGLADGRRPARALGVAGGRQGVERVIQPRVGRDRVGCVPRDAEEARTRDRPLGRDDEPIPCPGSRNPRPVQSTARPPPSRRLSTLPPITRPPRSGMRSERASSSPTLRPSSSHGPSRRAPRRRRSRGRPAHSTRPGKVDASAKKSAT